jgi:cytoskeletal protein CcmA (bactofilin family)
VVITIRSTRGSLVANILSLLESNDERFGTRIAAGTIIEGRITFTGDMRVDGTVKGDIEVWQSTTGTLVIGKEGRIEGDVRVTNAVVSGEVQGNVQAVDIVALGKSAHVTGDIRYGKMVARGQATVRGRVAPLADRIEPPRIGNREEGQGGPTLEASAA